MKSIYLVLLFLLMFVPSAFAKRVALVIGNDAYQEVPVLQKAVNDARAVSEALQNLGFDVDTGENLTRREINAQFARFVAKIQPGDTTFFFFSGHGVSLGGQNILLPVDVPAADNADLVRDEGHAVDDMIARVKSQGAGVSIFVLDACRNNPFAAEGRKGIGGTRGLQIVTPPTGTFVLMAAGAGQEALDRLSDSDPNPNSIFTRELLPLLRKPGMSHIAIAKAVQTSVEKDAKTVNHEQQPAFYDQVSGEVFLLPDDAAKVPAVTAPVTTPVVDVVAKPADPEVKSLPVADPALTDWNAIKDTRSIGILKAFITRYPKSAYADYAAAMVAELQAAVHPVEPVVPQKETNTVSIDRQSLALSRVRGGWFVFLGSFPHSDSASAQDRANGMANRGYSVEIIDSDDYRSLANGYYSVVMGPYSRSAALQLRDQAQRDVHDAYIKEVR